MQLDDLLASIPLQTELAVAPLGGKLANPVPSCPGWDVATLVSHLGGVQRWARRLVEAGSVEPSQRQAVQAPEGDNVGPWLMEGAQAFVESCQTQPPDAPAWNWTGGDLRVGFWIRRVAHETAVHGWDVRSACGQEVEIEPELASDAIDELLTVILPVRKPEGLTGTLHVHCTDADGEWVVDLGTLSVAREHAKAETALRGGASDLLLRLLNRGNGGEVLGDATGLDRWNAAFRF